VLLDLCIPPPCFAPEALTGAQRAGLRYQARVERWVRPQVEALGFTLHSGLWFRDPATGAPCSPDLLIESASSCLLLLEVKLTQTDCIAQFAKYRRALQTVSPSVPCVQVCRRLTSPSSMKALSDFHHGGVLLAYL